MATTISVQDFEPAQHLVICPLINKDVPTTHRVLMTDSTKKSYVYIKSECLFVEEVEGKIIKCRVIDDESKSMLDELDYFVLQEMNRNKSIFLPTTKKTCRNLIQYSRSQGSYIPLVISEKLKIFDNDNNEVTDVSELKHKIIRCVLSPLCVDISPVDDSFHVTFFGFSIAIMNATPPDYILEELREEDTEYVGGEGKEEDKTPALAEEVKFETNPFL